MIPGLIKQKTKIILKLNNKYLTEDGYESKDKIKNHYNALCNFLNRNIFFINENILFETKNIKTRKISK